MSISIYETTATTRCKYVNRLDHECWHFFVRRTVHELFVVWYCTVKKVSPVICWGFVFTGDIHVGSLGHQVLANPGIYIPMRPVPKVASSSVCQLVPMFSQAFYRLKMYKNEETKPVQTEKLSILIRFGGRVGWPAVLFVFGWYSRPSTLWLVGGRWMLIAGCWWKTRFKT